MKSANRFFSFVKKELLHILRDKRTLLILFGIPIAQVVLFGFAITNDLNNAPISILDRAHDQGSREITERLLSSGYFTLLDNLDHPPDIEAAFRKGKAKLIIEYGPDFYQQLMKGRGLNLFLAADASDPNMANLLVNYASAIINKYILEKLPAMANQRRIQPEVKMYFNPSMKSVFMFVPGVMSVILMLVSAMMTSISIAREKEQGTMEVLMVSPVKPVQIILAKVFPYLLLSLVNAASIVALAYFVFGMPVQGSLFLLGLEVMLFILTSLGLGILISTLVSTQQTAMMISLIALMLPTIILSGFIFPIENMPRLLQILTYIIPARWFLVIIKDIMLKGVGIAFFWKETLILAAMCLLLLGISIKKLKVRLE